jgi:hypothetical protein
MPTGSYISNTVSAIQDTFWNLIFNLHSIVQNVGLRDNHQTDKLDFMTSIQMHLEPYGAVAQSTVLPTYSGSRIGSCQDGYTISNQKDFLIALCIQAIRRDMLDPKASVPVQVVMDQVKMKQKQGEKLLGTDSGYASNESINDS